MDPHHSPRSVFIRVQIEILPGPLRPLRPRGLSWDRAQLQVFEGRELEVGEVEGGVGDVGGVGDGDGDAARSARGLDAGRRVLEGEALGGGHTEPSRWWSGRSPGSGLLSAPRRRRWPSTSKTPSSSSTVEHGRDHLVRRGRGEGESQTSGAADFDRPIDPPIWPGPRCGSARSPASRAGRGPHRTRVPPQGAARTRSSTTSSARSPVVRRQSSSVSSTPTGEDLPLGAAPQRLRVDEQPVHVEDRRLHRGKGNVSHPRPCPCPCSRSRVPVPDDADRPRSRSRSSMLDTRCGMDAGSSHRRSPQITAWPRIHRTIADCPQITQIDADDPSQRREHEGAKTRRTSQGHRISDPSQVLRYNPGLTTHDFHESEKNNTAGHGGRRVRRSSNVESSQSRSSTTHRRGWDR
jgi:hypothetical protein